MGVEFGGVGDMEFFEALEHLEERLAGVGSVVAGPAGDHAQVGAEVHCLLDAAEIGAEGKAGLLSDLVVVEIFVGFWGLF